MPRRHCKVTRRRKNVRSLKYLEFLESRVLLTTVSGALEVWGGNTDLTGSPDSLYAIDQSGYTQLGVTNAQNSAVTFSTGDVQYNYFVIVSRGQVQVDSVQGSDMAFVSTIAATGSASDNGSHMTGDSDGSFTTLGTQVNDSGTFAGFAEFANSNAWTSLTVQTGAMGLMLEGQISVQFDHFPGVSTAYNSEGDIQVNDNGLITAGEVRNPAGVWFPLTLNSDSDNSSPQWSFSNNFSSTANLNAAIPSGTYTFVLTSPLGTTTTQFSYTTQSLTPVPSPIGLTNGATGVSTSPTIHWNALNDANPNDDIGLEIDGPNNDNTAVVDDHFDVSATSDGPVTLAASSNYSLELRLNSFSQNAANTDGFIFNAEITNETDLLFRTAGTTPAVPALGLASIDFPDGTIHPGDWINLPVAGGNSGGNAIGKSSGVVVPVQYQAVLATPQTWGAPGNIVIGTGTIGTDSGGGAIGGTTFDGGVLVQIPSSVTPGTYFVGLRADSTNVVANNTGNTTVWSTTEITIAPNGNIVVTPASDQTASAGQGQSFGIGSFTASNTTGPYAVDLNWGDGSPDTIFALQNLGDIPATHHTYAASGNVPVTITVSDWYGEATNSVVFNANTTAIPTQLAFVPQPSGGHVGALSPVIVQIQDVNGSPVAFDNSNVTLSLADSSGHLTGATTVAAVNGVATFNNLSIDAANIYSLVATDSTDALPSLVSNPIDFTLAPNSIAGDVFTFFATDGAGGSVPPSATRVTIAASGDTDSQLNLIDGATQTNTFTYDAANGTITVQQSDHTSVIVLTFTSADAGTYTSSILGTLETQSGSFIVQTSPFAAADPKSLGGNSLALTIAGAGGSQYAASGTDSVSLNSNGTFHQGLTFGPVDGSYTFTQKIGAQPGLSKIVIKDKSGDPTSFLYLAFTSADTGMYYLTDATLPNGSSAHNDFQFGAFDLGLTTTRLAFAQQPAATTAGQTLTHASALTPSLVVDVLDSSGNIVTGDNSNVTIALTTPNSTLGGTTTVQAINGVATFTDLAIDQIGSYTLKATDGSLVAATSKSFTVSPDLASSQLTLIQPLAAGTALVGKALSPTLIVKAVDQFGNPVTSDRSKIILSTTGGTFAGASVVALSKGAATFKNIIFKTAGEYTLSATPASNSTLAITSPISITETINPGNTNIIPKPKVAAFYTFANTPISLSTTLTSSAPLSAVPFSGVVTLQGGNDANNFTANATLTAKGVAKFSFADPVPGLYNCTLTYPGDAAHTAASSASFTILINKAATTTTLTSSALSINSGDQLTLTAAVASKGAASVARTGTIDFHDGDNDLGSVTLAGNSTATFTYIPTSGTHNYTATYSGDQDFLAGDPAALSVDVNVAPLSILGQSFLLSATDGTVGQLPPDLSLLTIAGSGHTLSNEELNFFRRNTLAYSYTYTKTGPTTATLVAKTTGGSTRQTITTLLTFDTPTSGTAEQTFLSGATNTVNFILLGNPLPSTAPSTVAGLSIALNATNGNGVFAPSGTMQLSINASGNGYTLTGFPGDNPNSSGSYSYFQHDVAIGDFQFSDTNAGTGEIYLAFTSTTAGTYYDMPDFQGWQAGTFVVLVA